MSLRVLWPVVSLFAEPDERRPRDSQPLVTIGMPTYNRPAELGRAVGSALAQTHERLEVLISDNASPDPAVAKLTESLAASDARVRAVRQFENIGHARNYQWVLEAARGEYFMWLADDDWLDPQYVSRCLDVLTSASDAIAVCGLGRYYHDGVHLVDERPITLASSRPAARLLRYFSRVNLNGPMFGLARRGDLLSIGFPPVIGGDWLLIAALAARGRVYTLGDVHIHRSLDGLGGDASRLADSFGLQGMAARYPHVEIARRVWRAISFGSAAPGGVTPAARLGVATLAAGLVVGRFTLAAMIRDAIGPQRSATVEARVSAWLRRRDALSGN